MITQQLQKKIDFAIKLLQAIPSDDIELAFSGGKDSSVIMHLAKMAGIKFTAIYKNTTVDPKGNVAFCRSQGCEIRKPKISFLKLIEKKGFPTRRARFCCEVLKEYKIKDNAIIGVRKDESTARQKRYSEPQICRAYGNHGNPKKDRSNVVKQYFPILNWTNEDVEQYVNHFNIVCNPLYYDNGIFNVSKRLGCICCPLQGSKKLQQDFKDNPKFVKLWIRSGLVWWNKPREKEISSKAKFGTIYDLFYHNVFCNSYEHYLRDKNSIFGTMDCKVFLETFFNVKLD